MASTDRSGVEDDRGTVQGRGVCPLRESVLLRSAKNGVLQRGLERGLESEIEVQHNRVALDRPWCYARCRSTVP